MRRVINAFDEFLNLDYERISDAQIKVILPIKSLYINALGVVHGGIICSLADIAMGNALDIDENNTQKLVTVDLKTTFIKGAKGDFLIADAHLVKKGKSIHYVDCNIYNEKNELVAKANGIFAKSSN